MKLGAISSFSYQNSPAFGRKLREDEKPAVKRDIEEGLKILGKNMAIILPTNCSPTYKESDTGIGQPYSKSSNELLYPFLNNWGFSSQQKQPSGLGKQTDASPYVSNSSAYNTAIINLDELTKPESGAILSEETYRKIVDNNPKKGQDRSAYVYNVQESKKALLEAYGTFVQKRENKDSLPEAERRGIERLESDFQEFKETKGKEQEKNALYNILTDINGNDYWPNWSSETDKNLFATPRNDWEREQRTSRLNELRESHKKEIDSFLFSQMLAKKTIEKGHQTLQNNGIKGIGDIPVAFSDAEVWGNKDLFLDDLRMGCKEPWSDKPQKWGFFVLDPKKLFNQDGSLGEAGEFLYDKYERAFEENKGGVRIDHIVGLMDPYVYSENGGREGRLYSELYRGVNGDKCDRILRKIVLPAANKAGLNASNIIAEDLGYMPGDTKNTLQNLGIGGITVTQWCDAHNVWNAPKNNAVMIANHDTASAKELYPDKMERRNKFIELFSSGAKNVQIFWTDLFGIKERYNKPGVVGPENWSLRMTENFEDTYHKKLEENDALNIPEAILEANRRRNPNFSRDHAWLAESLKHWSNVLKEKEN